jgi:glutaminyl-tRNA synthetase
VREDLKKTTETRNVVENPLKVIITNYPEDKTEEMEIENNANEPEGEQENDLQQGALCGWRRFCRCAGKKNIQTFFPVMKCASKEPFFITCNEV